MVIPYEEGKSRIDRMEETFNKDTDPHELLHNALLSWSKQGDEFERAAKRAAMLHITIGKCSTSFNLAVYKGDPLVMCLLGLDETVDAFERELKEFLAYRQEKARKEKKEKDDTDKES